MFFRGCGGLTQTVTHTGVKAGFSTISSAETHGNKSYLAKKNRVFRILKTRSCKYDYATILPAPPPSSLLPSSVPQ